MVIIKYFLYVILRLFIKCPSGPIQQVTACMILGPQSGIRAGVLAYKWSLEPGEDGWIQKVCGE